MTLIKCRECSGTVSTAASQCPYCGMPVAAMRADMYGDGGQRQKEPAQAVARDALPADSTVPQAADSQSGAAQSGPVDQVEVNVTAEGVQDADQMAFWLDFIPKSFPETQYSIPGSIISLVWQIPAVAFGIGAVIFILRVVGVISPDYLPTAVAHPSATTAVSLMMSSLYVIGPLVFVGFWLVYFKVNNLERAIQYRLFAASQLNSQKTTVLTRMADAAPTYFTGEAASSEFEREVSRRFVREARNLLLGYPFVSWAVYLGGLAVNWVAIGTQFYYGVQWAFSSKWVAIPVLVLWGWYVLLATAGPVGAVHDIIFGGAGWTVPDLGADTQLKALIQASQSRNP